MASFLPIAQMIIATLLVILILLQQRGTALGSLFGGDSGGSYATRRGIQRQLLVSTVVIGALFIILSVAHFIL